ncbi:hypothetical protein HJG54_26215 [Leptolyngbya sp. NK1-12]|uniref:Uncharacterized protein n=1 Tax=Leptolyngbya sp. NK1-12 TaxID=2547451 RepID=A0AA97AIW4_9CYAN|nr:hypothetical protein [Leptolyngbya sp. NK1-12]WNZ25979.1 hypothetical protein HJG54_26215 [Leptolyngbya sp. NK1-12]
MTNRNNLLRNILVGAGIATVGAIGTKAAVDYFKNRGEEDVPDESQGDQLPASAAEVAYAKVQDASLQKFLDVSFGEPGRYVPNRPAKVFDYQGKQYMVVWARDNKKNKNQMLAFIYTPEGRKMIASVGYTNQETDYNINLGSTPFAVEVKGQKLTSGQGKTKGADEVDFVLA